MKFVALGHNTIRGAAGAAILNAELMQIFRREQFRQTEIQDHCLSPRRDHDVARLNVAVDDAPVVRGRQRIGHLNGDRQKFFRIHRSRIVNMERIQEMQPWLNGEYAVVLRTGTRLTLSRGYREKLQERLGRGA